MVDRKRSIVFIVVGMVLGFMLGLLISRIELRNVRDIISYQPMIVTSGSMEPVIKTNSIIVVKKCTADDVRIGDIIVYKYGNMTIVHRLVGVGGENSYTQSFITKGDANDKEDNIEVTSDMIQGKVVSIHNNLAKYVNLIMVDGKVDSKELRVVLFLLFLLLIIIIVIIVEAYKYISIAIKLLMHQSYFEGMIKKYNRLLRKQQAYVDYLKRLESKRMGNVAKFFIKVIILKEIMDLEVDVKDTNYLMRLFSLNKKVDE